MATASPLGRITPVPPEIAQALWEAGKKRFTREELATPPEKYEHYAWTWDRLVEAWFEAYGQDGTVPCEYLLGHARTGFEGSDEEWDAYFLGLAGYPGLQASIPAEPPWAPGHPHWEVAKSRLSARDLPTPPKKFYGTQGAWDDYVRQMSAAHAAYDGTIEILKWYSNQPAKFEGTAAEWRDFLIDEATGRGWFPFSTGKPGLP